MSKLTSKTLLCSALALLSLAAVAQPDDHDRTIATLQVNKGVVMTSTGGEFVTANTGENLIKDERLMVSKESSATVIFNDHCRRTYDEPGVYKIDADCKAVVWFGAAIVAGVVAVGVVVHNLGDTPDENPPISR